MKTRMRDVDSNGMRFARMRSVFMSREALLSALLLLSAVVAAAATQLAEIPGQPWKGYFGENKDASAVIREAVRLGHIVPGMTRGQVAASLGEPIRKVRSTKTAGVEHWYYRVDKLHQEQFRGRGWSVVRITFLDERVVMVDPR